MEQPQQPGEISNHEEPDEVLQRDLQSPAPGDKKTHPPVHAGGQPAGKQLCHAGEQVGQEPAVCPCSKEGKQPPGLY